VQCMMHIIEILVSWWIFHWGSSEMGSFFNLIIMPTIDIPDKICPHCGGTKWYMTKHTNGKLHINTCFYKMAERRKAFRATDKGKEFTNNYYKTPAGKKHREKYQEKESTKKLRSQLAINQYHRDMKNNREKVLERKSRYDKKLRAKLTDGIVKHYIIKSCSEFGLKINEIPPELIELKRKQIQLYRKLK